MAARKVQAGVSFQQAQAEMSTIAARIEREYPKPNPTAVPGMEIKGLDTRVIPLGEHITGNVRHALSILSGAVFFVLLIGCVNLANLFLARGAARGREFAVRAALGAGRGRLVRQLLTEGLALALVGGAAGLLFAFCGNPGVESLCAGRDSAP
ncbi:MAG: hypothetical protein DMG58_24390 [Acidobacteria bacterium]|nr:MAG: hypothetical protein DMG58_24390 [Acidobacteriota bacterium]